MKKILILCLMIFIILPAQIKAAELTGHREEDAISVYDQQGKYVFATAMGVTTGDRYINEDNIEYQVISVNGNRAIAEKKGKVDLLEGFTAKISALPPIAANETKKVAIYHTHNDESYAPGPESVRGKGQIHQIGQVLKNALEKKGVKVIYSDNLHLPHDGAAYERSRATATNLAQQRPNAIFDIHRDAIPRRDEYLKKVNGKVISQIRLVVGRQNPNRKVNDQFARRLKATADNQYPGLIKGIFYGGGNYNQHISPHSLLLEFGTHVTTKDQAIVSAGFLADSINQLLYGQGEEEVASENRSIATTISWILGIAIIGILIFLFINEGSIEGVINRIKGFFKREIIDRGDNQ